MYSTSKAGNHLTSDVMEKPDKCNHDKIEQEKLVTIYQHELYLLKEKAGEHRRQKSIQQNYLIELCDQSRHDCENKVPFSDRHDLLVCDYSQNLDLPHFGGEQ